MSELHTDLGITDSFSRTCTTLNPAIRLIAALPWQRGRNETLLTKVTAHDFDRKGVKAALDQLQIPYQHRFNENYSEVAIAVSADHIREKCGKPLVRHFTQKLGSEGGHTTIYFDHECNNLDKKALFNALAITGIKAIPTDIDLLTGEVNDNGLYFNTDEALAKSAPNVTAPQTRGFRIPTPGRGRASSAG